MLICVFYRFILYNFLNSVEPTVFVPSNSFLGKAQRKSQFHLQFRQSHQKHLTTHERSFLENNCLFCCQICCLQPLLLGYVIDVRCDAVWSTLVKVYGYKKRRQEQCDGKIDEFSWSCNADE